MVDHSLREHSIYGFSGWHRWSNCPGSAQRCEGVEQTSSDAAAEGTWKHERVDEILRDVPRSDEPGGPYDTEDNWDQVNKVVEYVRDLVASCSIFTPADVWHEQRLSFDGVGSPEVFGTADLTIYDEDEKHLYMGDYKFGQVLVSPQGNGQLMMAASAAILELPIHPKLITLMILQPIGNNPFKLHTITKEELDAWEAEEMWPALQAAQQDGAPIVPGTEQCKYCPVKGNCPEQRQKNIDVFEDHQRVLKDNEYTDLLPQLDEMEQFIKAVREQALDFAKKGGNIKGYKLVQSVTHRKWLDESKAESWIARNTSLKVSDRRVTKLLSVPQMVKALKTEALDKKKWTAFDKYVFQPPGQIKLVPESDSGRPVDISNPILDGELI